MDLNSLLAMMGLSNTIGTPTPQPGTSRFPVPQTVAPGKVDLPTAPIPPVPVPAPVPQTTVPGAQKIPIPSPRPLGLLGQLFGPSISPSQQGVVSESPSQGPGPAVGADPRKPLGPVSILDAIKQVSQPAAARAPTAPAPPGPARMAPGAAAKLIGGQNPLAQVAQTPPIMVLLSKLLGGR